jgi:anoctamin-10
MAFHFAWMSFYTTWLIIPAIGGIIITIYHIIEGVDSTFNTLYALLVCIWVTVFIERWKRKSSEICLRWGITDFINNSDREERKDHLGYEYFSHDSHRVEKKTVHTRKMICGLTL